MAVTINPPTFTQKPNTRKQQRTKRKTAFCVPSECWWEGHSLSSSKTTEKQTALTGDKTNTAQRTEHPCCTPGHQTAEGDSKGGNRKASFAESQEMCSDGGVSVSVQHSLFIPQELIKVLSGQEAAENSAAGYAQGFHRCSVSVSNTSPLS